jgi:hypothetical protein
VASVVFQHVETFEDIGALKVEEPVRALVDLLANNSQPELGLGYGIRNRQRADPLLRRPQQIISLRSEPVEFTP